MLVLAFAFVYFTSVIETRKVQFTLEETYQDERNHFEARWFTSKSYPKSLREKKGPILEYLDVKSKNVFAYDASINETFILLSPDDFTNYDYDWYQFSSDRAFVLLRRDKSVDSIQPWLTLYKYVVYSPKDKEYKRMGNAYLQRAQWIPGKTEILYVKSNNIYIAQVLPKMTFYQITTDGVPGLILNGIPDFTNQGETFNRRNMLAASPNGIDIVYIKLNYTEVPVTSFPIFGNPGSLDHQYPKNKYFRYPKPGERIPTYSVWHFNTVTNEGRILTETAEGMEIPGEMQWLTNRIIQIIFLNRVQNVSQVELCSMNAERKPCRKVYEDRNTRGWASDRLLRFSKTGERYIARAREHFQGDEFYHLQIIYRNGTKISLIEGNLTVSHIIDWDEDKRLVYFQSYKVNHPSASHTFAVHEGKRGKPYCMTCQMKSPEGVPCKFGYVSFSSNFEFFTGTCNGPTPEVVYVYKNVIPVGEPLKVIDNNGEIRIWLAGKLEPKVINIRVPVTSTMQAEVRLKLPPDMDYSGNTKYPLIIYVDGRPDFDQIDDRFQIDWSLYLTTNRSIIYAIIDGRGTGRKGTGMLYSVYRALGTVEVEDQIFVTKYLHGKLRFIDRKRTGIWGLGYGGYATTKVLENDSGGVFKCGVAVSPITDWIYHNAIYTERYMGLPSANKKAYENSSTLYIVENLRNKEYLLIHGTGDKDVHYQNSMALAKVLQDNNILFEQAVYPDEDHNSSSCLHIFYTINRFFQKCFNLPINA